MPKILLQNLHNKEIFTFNDTETLLSTIQANYIDWMHACGGKGRCTTCKVIVVEGLDNLTPITLAEDRFIKMSRLGENERLACQCSATADVIIRVADENKFNHMEYSA